MKNSEEAIDKVLAGLRDSEAPTGMERRIMETLQHCSVTRSSSRMWQQTAIVPVFCGALTAVVILAVLMTPAVRRANRVPVQTHTSAAPPALPPSAPKIVVGSVKFPPRHADTRSTTMPSKKSPKQANDMDAIALEEMRAPSQPPPPIPLTAQEKLLLRVVYNRDPVQLAALTPAARARDDAQEEADFQKFFTPPEQPKTGDTE
jgi:hypothetical protein